MTVKRPVIRKDGKDKVTGRAQYVDDLCFPNMIYGVSVRSSVARGKIQKITYEGDLPWKDITVATSHDLPGPNVVAHILQDQQCLATENVQHPDEAILLLAHPDRQLLEEARRKVRVEIDPLPSIHSIEDSLNQKTVIWGKDNILKSFVIEKGNIAPLWNEAALVVQGEYRTGAQEQLYIEPNGMIASVSPAGITVWGSMQCPYYVHHALMVAFNLPKEKVRVIQTETGGGFGGKEDYPSMIACHAALLSLKSGKPVKIIYDRAEDMACTTKRHPSITRHKTALSKDGKLLAMDIEFLLDGGAYATMSPVVLSRGAIHAAGAYNCPNIRITAKALATNTAPYGAFRGFGAPQSLFALEMHMDRIALQAGLTPEEFRARNFLQEGHVTATGQTLRENPDLPGLMGTALNALGYHAKRANYADHNRNPNSRIKKGVGFSVFLHGAGFTGSGEKNLASVVAVEATPFGRVRVLASSTEIGQGARTVFAQLAADALGIDYDQVDVAQPDTHIVPNSGPTVASRTTMIVGKLVETAAIGLKEILIQSGHLKSECSTEDFSDQFRNACASYIKAAGPLKSFAQYQQPGHIQWDDTKYQGDAYGTFTWAVYAAEVSVDLTTYEARVDNFVAAQEVGKVIHPVLAAGQIEGGVTQGIGYALYEEVRLENGRMINNRMTNYIVPTAQDVPPIQVIFAENPYAHAPHGAKGIGELPLDGVAPAILNAVAFATGTTLTEIPLLPETLMRAMSNE